jgi:hypothetical protein
MAMGRKQDAIALHFQDDMVGINRNVMQIGFSSAVQIHT